MRAIIIRNPPSPLIFAGDFDGDRFADPVMVAANGVWKIWMSSADYVPVSTIPTIPLAP